MNFLTEPPIQRLPSL